MLRGNLLLGQTVSAHTVSVHTSEESRPPSFSPLTIDFVRRGVACEQTV